MQTSTLKRRKWLRSRRVGEGERKGGQFAIASRSKVFRLFTSWIAAAFLALLSGVYPLNAQQSPSVPQLTFTRTLKGSSPEYIALSVDANGKGAYDSHSLKDAPSPHPIQISEDTTERIFSLADSLDDFRGLNLDSRHRVANMGLKVFTYEAGAQVYRVQFNYTENHAAQQLADILDKISNVEELINQLEYDMKYDHLSLPQTLLQVQSGLDDHDYVEAALMIPTLEKISANPRYLHLAQVRAQEIIQRIQENK